jgi:hypothetical protein
MRTRFECKSISNETKFSFSFFCINILVMIIIGRRHGSTVILRRNHYSPINISTQFEGINANSNDPSSLGMFLKAFLLIQMTHNHLTSFRRQYSKFFLLVPLQACFVLFLTKNNNMSCYSLSLKIPSGSLRSKILRPTQPKY